MVPVGFLAKFICRKPECMQSNVVRDIFSVSGCVNDDFLYYYNYWKHNEFWFFDTPSIIRDVAKDANVDLVDSTLFFYEQYEREFDGKGWRIVKGLVETQNNVEIPVNKCLVGYDVVTYFVGTSPECSPLSCNGLMSELPVNEHCLFPTFEDAEKCLSSGAFLHSEPGPYRIVGVYIVPDWPEILANQG